MPIELSQIFRYPVKSTRREELSVALVQPWGLAGDRRWMLVDEAGKVVTAREVPRLLLITARENGSGLRFNAPEMDDLEVAIPAGVRLPVQIWRSEVVATSAADSAHAWLSSFLGRRVRLVYLDDPTRRSPNPLFSDSADRVSFADGYPLLLASEESLAQLNEWIADGPRSDEGPVPITRFRPNVVVRGGEPFVEDQWRHIRIGSSTFRAVKACDRCVLTTINPETAEKGKEPITTLASRRRWDGATWFGVNLIPDLSVAEFSDQTADSAQSQIRVGDPVEVLQMSDVAEPLREPEAVS
ncbi:hypothetical protein SAMN05892883_2532 [Jatrophihabitans sp. GAS493]|uniref:MOSC domain-containing protein n=1 Tax=Jatrophihabitans sp. GAS493 TaxID=1907575 RepID=UPI000BB7D423|nr:MOSC N-terminal beta barrel domain-containing protein [Jatrophihabitans sp. GAS493]SOD73242.1 hypothetical protein SAMN05892883_2532 [Jatrophihabitans sp. GAS493]